MTSRIVRQVEFWGWHFGINWKCHVLKMQLLWASIESNCWVLDQSNWAALFISFQEASLPNGNLHTLLKGATIESNCALIVKTATEGALGAQTPLMRTQRGEVDPCASFWPFHGKAAKKQSTHQDIQSWGGCRSSANSESAHSRRKC